MFGKFGGIVIIALSGAIIAGLILRPTPDLPPAMSLGVPDSPATASTLEPTVDNQDKKPATIEPVADAIKATEKKVVEVAEKLDVAVDSAIGETKVVVDQVADTAKPNTEEAIKDELKEETKKAE